LIFAAGLSIDVLHMCTLYCKT